MIQIRYKGFNIENSIAYMLVIKRSRNKENERERERNITNNIVGEMHRHVVCLDTIRQYERFYLPLCSMMI